MAKITNQIKLAWLKGVQVVGNTASNLASNAKHKVAEMNLETRRREIMSEFTLQAFELWQKGEKLPEPLDKLFQELSELDERLSVLRAQRYVAVGQDEKKDGAEADATSAEAVDATAAAGVESLAAEGVQGEQELAGEASVITEPHAEESQQPTQEGQLAEEHQQEQAQDQAQQNGGDWQQHNG